MADGTNSNSRTQANPLDLWKQWSDTNTRIWSGVMGEGTENKAPYADPYSLYQSWLKSVQDAQEQMMTSAAGMMDFAEVWKQWFSTTTDAVRKASEGQSDPLGLTKQWLAMMEEASNKLLTGKISLTDPFTFFKQWYDATNEAWAQTIADVIGTEKFIEVCSQFLEGYARFTKATRHASEEYFKNLQIPTRSDVARVAELIIALEEKVDQIEDAFEVFTDDSSDVATSNALETLGDRLNRVESKLDQVLAAFEKLEARDKEIKPAQATRSTTRKTSKTPQTPRKTASNQK